MEDLFSAGCHFGHATHRWNPKMKPYIFGIRGGVHIIDLDKTVVAMNNALKAIYDTTARGGRVLFVGTKMQSQNEVMEAAVRSGQYYVNARWLGGMMTNWKTISQSVKRFKDLENKLAGDLTGYTKKERLNMERDVAKLRQNLGGIKEMYSVPDMLISLDTIKEEIAIQEAVVLGIPVVAICDSNSSPTGVTYPIPGNDDATRAIKLYCDVFARTILAGIEKSIATGGGDLGERTDVTQESKDETKDGDRRDDRRGDRRGDRRNDGRDGRRGGKFDGKSNDKTAKVEAKVEAKADEAKVETKVEPTAEAAPVAPTADNAADKKSDKKSGGKKTLSVKK
ncbi:MAG: 30S ribosomal protein S2 [Hydrotalea sp.]|nr:30S ribosomal protein S2 [Hydrotalea sp.]